jgi:hypothetical protein
VLRSYQEIRDRIYVLARQHGLRPDWVEHARSARLLLLYDAAQIVVGRALVPVRHIDDDRLADLQLALAHIFGKDWLE